MKKRRLNIKFLLTLSGVVLVFSVGVYFLHMFQMDRNADHLKQIAEKALAEGQYREAAKSYRRYVNIRPDDPEGFTAFAMAVTDLAENADGVDARDMSNAYTVLQKAVRQAPENQVLRKRMVEFMMGPRMRSYREALPHLEFLLERDPTDVSLQVKAARCLVRTLDYEKAIAKLNELVGYDPQKKEFDSTQATGADQVECYVMLANVLLMYEKDDELAKQVMNRMVEINPDSSEAALERARYRRRRGDLVGASADINRAWRADSEDAQVILARADFNVFMIKKASALSELAFDPSRQEEVQQCLEVANFDDASDQDDATKIDEASEQFAVAAREALVHGMDFHKDDERMYRSIALFEITQLNYDQALKYVEEGLKKAPDSIALLLTKADLLLIKDDRDGLRELIKRMQEARLARDIVDYIEARILIVEKQWMQAIGKLERIRPLMEGISSLPQQIDTLLGVCYEKMGQFDLARAAYGRARRADVGARAAAAGLARMEARVALLDPETTSINDRVAEQKRLPKEDRDWTFLEEEFAKIADEGKVTGAEKVMLNVRLYETMEDYNRAWRTVESARIKFPKHKQQWWRAILRLAWLDPATTAQEALEYVKRAEEDMDTNDEQLRKTIAGGVGLWVDRGDYRKARDLINAAKQRYPGEVSLWIAEADLNGEDPLVSPSQVFEVLDQAQEKFGNVVLIRLKKAQWLVSRHAKNLKRRLADLEVAVDRLPLEERTRFWTAMGGIYYRALMRQEAKRCWMKVAELNPQDLPIRTHLFDLALEQGDGEAMEKSLSSISDLVGRSDPVWLYGAASSLLFRIKSGQEDKSSLDQVQQLVNKALEGRPRWSELYRLQANIDIENNDLEQAVRNLRLSFQYGVARPSSVQKLVSLLTHLGRPVEAEEAVRLLGGESTVVTRTRIQNLMKSGQTEKALELAKKEVDADSEDAAKHLAYARGLLATGRPEEAEVALRRAVALNHHDPRNWLALVSYLLEKDDLLEAEATMRQAQINVDEDLIPLVLARFNERLDRSGEAEENLLAVHRLDLDNLNVARILATFYLGKGYAGSDRVAKASKYLNQIFLRAGKKKKNREHLVWARRTAARILAAKRNYQDIQKAVEFLEANKVNGELPLDDMLEKALILVRRPEPIIQEEAKKLLQQIKDKRGLANEHQLILAKSYNQSGEWESCRSLMLELLEEDGSEEQKIRNLAVYTRMLLMQDKLERAERYLTRLEALDPDGNLVLEIRTRLLAQQGKKQEAIATAGKLLPKKIEIKDVGLVLRVALLCEKSELYDQAEKLYRIAVEVVPRAVLTSSRTRTDLVGFLARQGNVAEAMALLDRAFESHPASLVIQRGLETVRDHRHQVGDQYDATVEKWINLGDRRNPGAAVMTLFRAQLFDSQENYEQVVSLYRKLLDRPDLSEAMRALVLNNLAYVLTLRDKNKGEDLGLIEEAISLLGPRADLLDTRGVVWLTHGDHQRAIEDLSLAVAGEQNGMTFFHLALAHAAVGDLVAAEAAMVKARDTGLTQETVYPLEKAQYQQLMRELGVKQVRRAG